VESAFPAGHFFPLASTPQNPRLRPLGVLLIAVAAAALVTGLTSAVAPSTVTGAGAGLCLLAFGFATLLAGRRAPSPPD
jgi:dipeptide/tripeptide permease